MTVIRLADGRVWIHAPGPLDEELRAEIDAIGPVVALIAPGNFHHIEAREDWLARWCTNWVELVVWTNLTETFPAKIEGLQGTFE